MIEDLKKVQDKVQYLLERYPQTRDSDKELWLAYNVHFRDLKTAIQSRNYMAFRRWLMHPDTPMFESLSRARRKIQENHPHLAGEKAKRMEEAKEVADWAVKN